MTMKSVREYRNVPFAKVGMRVEVDGKPGKITGANSSMYFNVKFDDRESSSNCHPHWKFKYFDNNGVLIAHFGIWRIENEDNKK